MILLRNAFLMRHVLLLALWFPILIHHTRASDSSATDPNGDLLPQGAKARLGSARFKHSGKITVIALSPNGDRLATGGNDSSLRMWRLWSGQEHFVFEEAGAECPGQLVFSQDSRYIGSVWKGKNNDQFLHVLSADSGRAVFSRHLGKGDTFVRTLAFSDNGKDLVVGYVDQSISLVKLSDGQESLYQDLPATANAILCSNRIAALSIDNTEILYWDVETGKPIHRLRGGHKNKIRCISVSRRAMILASGSADEKVRLWNLSNGTELLSLHSLDASVSSFTFSPDGKRLVTISVDSTIRVWDTGTGKEVWALHTPEPALALSTDGTRLLFVDGESHTIRCWDIERKEELVLTSGHKLPAPSVSFSSDSKKVSSLGLDSVGCLWDARTGRTLTTLPIQRTSAYMGDLLAEGLIIERSEETVTLREFTNNKVFHQAKVKGTITCVGSSHDRRYVAFAINRDKEHTGAVIVQDRVSGRTLHQLEGVDFTRSITFSPEGDFIACGGESLKVWNLATGAATPLAPSKGGDRSISKLAYSPDGRLLSVVSDSISIWDTVAKKQLFHIPGTSFSFSPDMRHAASGTPGGELVLWDLNGCEELKRIKGKDGRILALSFSPNGKWLASSNANATIVVWDCDFYSLPRSSDHPTKAIPKYHWSNLGNLDCGIAFRTIWILFASGDTSVEFLRKNIRPDSFEEYDAIDALVRNLDDGSFEVRRSAFQALVRTGRKGTIALQKDLLKNRSLESRMQILRLLDDIDQSPVSSDWLRDIRAIHTLELIGTSNARDVLEQLAKGPSLSWKTAEALKALARLKKRSN